jgi:transcriptional regulator GlxA family with amidase domain
LIPTIRLEVGCRYLVLRQPVACLPFPENLVCGVLIAADHHPRQGAVTAESHAALPHVLRTAVEIMEAQADTPLTVAMVAACSHVSVRALQKAFRRHLQISPMAYLRDVRLRRAHEALVEADPSTETVASICHRWSFTHPGRFAALHTARYGESPSATLHRMNI